MTVHISRCHHRPAVRRTRGISKRWWAYCQQCGWMSTWHDCQHEAFVIALAHAEGSLR